MNHDSCTCGSVGALVASRLRVGHSGSCSIGMQRNFNGGGGGGDAAPGERRKEGGREDNSGMSSLSLSLFLLLSVGSLIWMDRNGRDPPDALGMACDRVHFPQVSQPKHGYPSFRDPINRIIILLLTKFATLSISHSCVEMATGGGWTERTHAVRELLYI